MDQRRHWHRHRDAKRYQPRNCQQQPSIPDQCKWRRLFCGHSCNIWSGTLENGWYRSRYDTGKRYSTGNLRFKPEWLVNINGTLYFRADNGANGLELWKSDGTEAG